jgi:hypothetical protein
MNAVAALLRSTSFGNAQLSDLRLREDIDAVVAGFGAQADALRELAGPLLEAAAVWLEAEEVGAFAEGFRASLTDSSYLTRLAEELMMDTRSAVHLALQTLLGDSTYEETHVGGSGCPSQRASTGPEVSPPPLYV